jgi:hypothetical protein
MPAKDPKDVIPVDGKALLEFVVKLEALAEVLVELDLDVPTMAALLDVRDAGLKLAETLDP